VIARAASLRADADPRIVGRKVRGRSSSRMGTFPIATRFACTAPIRMARRRQLRGRPMNGLIYLIGLIVVIMAILSFFGLR
jgi:hypothetical protein